MKFILAYNTFNSIQCGLEQEVAELQDQLRDVMFYLDAKDKLEASEDVTQEELQEGQIVVQPAPSASVGPSSERRKKQRKKAR